LTHPVGFVAIPTWYLVDTFADVGSYQLSHIYDRLFSVRRDIWWRTDVIKTIPRKTTAIAETSIENIQEACSSRANRVKPL